MRTPNIAESSFIELYEKIFFKDDKISIQWKWVLLAISLRIRLEQEIMKISQQFIPKAKSGGIVKGCNSQGEIVTLPDGSQVIPNDIAEQIAKEKKINITVNLNGEKLYDTKKK